MHIQNSFPSEIDAGSVALNNWKLAKCDTSGLHQLLPVRVYTKKILEPGIFDARSVVLVFIGLQSATSKCKMELQGMQSLGIICVIKTIDTLVVFSFY